MALGPSHHVRQRPGVTPPPPPPVRWQTLQIMYELQVFGWAGRSDVLAFNQYGIVAWQTCSCQNHLRLLCSWCLPRRVCRAVLEFALRWGDVFNRGQSHIIPSLHYPGESGHGQPPWAPPSDDHLAFCPQGLCVIFRSYPASSVPALDIWGPLKVVVRRNLL